MYELKYTGRGDHLTMEKKSMRLYCAIFLIAFISLATTQTTFAQPTDKDSMLMIKVLDGKFIVNGVVDNTETKLIVLTKLRGLLSSEIPDESVKIDNLARPLRDGWEEVLNKQLPLIRTWKSGVYTLSVDRDTESLRFVERLGTTEVVRLDTNAKERLIDPSKKITIVFLLATWCGPCIAPIPDLSEIYEKYSSRGLDIVAVDSDPDDTTKMLRKLADTYRIRFRLRIGDQIFEKQATRYSNFDGIPKIFIIRDQKVEYTGRGYARSVREEITSTLDRLFSN